MKSGEKNKKSKFPIIMGVIWGGIIAIAIGVIISIFNYEDDYFKSADRNANSILSEEYGVLFSDISYKQEDGLTAEKHPEYAELIAASDYIGACGHYYMYLGDNQTEKADYYYAKMQEAMAGMDKLKYLTGKIDQHFRKLNQ